MVNFFLQVNCILRANEHTQDFVGGSVKCYDSNQLASNSPIEDSRTEGTCVHTSGLLLGIFDGHGGPACSQVISKRLMRYIAASLVPPDDLKVHMKNGAQSHSFINCHNDKVRPELNHSPWGRAYSLIFPVGVC